MAKLSTVPYILYLRKYIVERKHTSMINMETPLSKTQHSKNLTIVIMESNVQVQHVKNYLSENLTREVFCKKALRHQLF